MKLKILTLSIVAFCFCGFYQSCATASAELNTQEELAWCHDKVIKSLETLGTTTGNADYAMMPRNIEGESNVWHCRPAVPEEWCSGFWPGILWMDYAASKDEEIRKQTELYTASMQSILNKPVYDHDLGFMFFCSCGKGYEVTGNPVYKKMILQAADSLATLYNPVVGTDYEKRAHQIFDTPSFNLIR